MNLGHQTNSKRFCPTHIIIKLSKAEDKERILKPGREKELVTYKGTPTRVSGNFSPETLQARRQWDDVFKVMKEKTANKENLIWQRHLSEMEER